MSPAPRPDPLGLLAEHPERFDLFQALRLLEGAYPDRPRLGRAKRAADEPVRLSQPPFVTMAPAQIAGFEPGGNGPARLSTYALGLFGPQGPLPLHVTLHAFERARHHDDPTLAHFADIFQHRLLALFYRAWADAQPTVQHDRPAADRFRYYLGSLFGLGMAAQQDRDTVPDRFKLFHAGGLGMQTRPPEVLERLVRDFFQVPAAVREFTGGWLRLPEALCCRLGVEANSSRLGRGAVAGTRILQRQQRFRLRLGPLKLADFRRFLPPRRWPPEHGNALERLRDLVRLAAGLELEWDLHLGLLAAEVPDARLDGQSALGWTSWLPTGTKRTKDAWDLVLFRPGEAGGAAELRA